MIVCGILTDGRAELFATTWESARQNVEGVDQWFVVNDSGDPNYQTWIKQQVPDALHVAHSARRGLAGAVQSVWETALELGADYLFHLEGDFTINQPVDLNELRAVLDANSELAQIVLQRQPMSGDEWAAGGVAAHAGWVEQDGWVEQTSIFSLNPCLIPARILKLGWPSGPLGVGNEAGMTALLTSLGFRFGFWGHKHSAPHVTHTGVYRSDGWQL